MPWPRASRALGAVGRMLIRAGALILLFVVFQLWGTGLSTRQAQDDLRDQFEATPVEPAPVADRPDEPRRAPRPVVPAAPPSGQLVGRIEIPSIGVDFFFLEGVDLDTLQDGPGHYPGTPLPGQPGNAAIAGHRTTYLHPFLDLDDLGPGDRIHVSYPGGPRFTYEFQGSQVVDPSQVDVLYDKGDDRLTLTACNPKYSARERLIVTARLVDPPAPTPPPTPDRAGDPTPRPPPVDLGIGGDLDGARGPAGPAVAWGLLAAALWLGANGLGRLWRRWPVYLVATPLFLMALFGFFQRFNQLLPAAI